jgi:hypothetical protein
LSFLIESQPQKQSSRQKEVRFLEKPARLLDLFGVEIENGKK